MKKNRFLITGGAGYIGSVLTRHLLEKGHSVRVVDNLMYRQQTPLFFIDNPNYEFVYGDVRDKRTLEDAILNVDSIIPLAAIVGMPACEKKPRDAESINRDAIFMLNNLRSREQRLIFPTTNSGYGTQTGETYCTEETPLTPISLYGTTKAEAEKALLDSNKGAVTLRLATVFGLSPRMRLDLLVNDFVWKALTDSYLVLFEKNFKRNFIHIKDIAGVFEHCNEKYDLMKGTMYNIGLDSANISKDELAVKIKKYLPKLQILEAPLAEDPDKRNYIVSSEKIKEKGFIPTHTLDEGIEELINGYSIMLKNRPERNV